MQTSEMYVFDIPTIPSSVPHSNREHTAHTKFWLKPNKVKLTMTPNMQNNMVGL